MFVTTTAGLDRNSICYEKYTNARQVLNGTSKDNAFVGRIFEVPEATSFEDVAKTDARAGSSTRTSGGWLTRRCSAAMAASCAHEIETKVRDAMHIPAAQNNVMNLHFNVWTQAESRWFSRHAWDSCGGVGKTSRSSTDGVLGRARPRGTADFNALVYVFPWRRRRAASTCSAASGCPRPRWRSTRRRCATSSRSWERAGYLERDPRRRHRLRRHQGADHGRRRTVRRAVHRLRPLPRDAARRCRSRAGHRDGPGAGRAPAP